MSEFKITPTNASQVLDALYDQALERMLYNVDWRDYLTDDELARYEAAMKLIDDQAVSSQAAAIGKVVIEVSGGVAEVTSKPDAIEVEIIDHDNDEVPDRSEPGVVDDEQHYDDVNALHADNSKQGALTDCLGRADLPQEEGA